MPPYRYLSLEYVDSIRLLILHPSSNDQSPITCTIRHARLSDAWLKYEAISYTWGNVTCHQPIYFHSHKRELRVRTNCHDALRHLRQEDRDRQLWIDAICINQEDLNERANQVRLMEKIYQIALDVIVYLGEDTPGSRVLFGELADADTELSLRGTCDRPPPSDLIIGELDNLLQRPWFKRVWVLQEVHMNASVTFMCGLNCASSIALSRCLFGYRNNTLVTRLEDILAISLIERGIKSYPTAQLSLWYLLYWSRTFLATDYRDKVFALRSLISQRRTDMDFLISYVENVEEIFTKTAIFLLPALGLQLLTATRHPHTMEMPSWIPDWSQRLPLDFYFFSFLDELSESQSPDTNTLYTHSLLRARSGLVELHVKGMRYSKISHMSQPFLFSSLGDAEAQMKDMYYHLKNLRNLLSPTDISDRANSPGQLGQDLMDGTCKGRTTLE